VLLLNGSSTNPFSFNVGGWPGQMIVVEAATNLVSWTPLQTNTVPDAGVFPFVDLNSAGLASRFYRARVW
jgi:hypothetical protein